MVQNINIIDLSNIDNATFTNQVLILEKRDEKMILSPALIRSCMNPDKLKKIDITIEKTFDNKILIKDANHFLEFEQKDLLKYKVYTKAWNPEDPYKASGCIPCRNCGRC